MSDMIEIDRIRENIGGEVPEDTSLELIIKADDASSRLSKIQEVALSIAFILNSEDNCVTEVSFWRENLPAWFVQTMTDVTIDDLFDEPSIWDFESWIEAVNVRQWEWYSSILTENGFTIFLETFGIPYQIDPFVYVINVSGVEHLNINIVEHLD
jgi:hypothetical protein